MSEATMQTVPTDWAVFDKNARTKEGRTHEPLVGVTYTLFHDKPTPMPKAHAVVFLRDASFRVIDERGREQVGIPEAEAVDPRNARPKLEPGETIAKFEELLDTALLARVVMRPGGHDVPEDRESMIAFLATAPFIAEIPADQRERPSEFADPTMLGAEGSSGMVGGENAVQRVKAASTDPFEVGG